MFLLREGSGEEPLSFSIAAIFGANNLDGSLTSSTKLSFALLESSAVHLMDGIAFSDKVSPNPKSNAHRKFFLFPLNSRVNTGMDLQDSAVVALTSSAY